MILPNFFVFFIWKSESHEITFWSQFIYFVFKISNPNNILKMFQLLKKTFKAIKPALPWAKKTAKSIYDDPDKKEWVKKSVIRYITNMVLKHCVQQAIECCKDYSWIVFVCNMILWGMSLYSYYNYAIYSIK